MAKKSVRSGLKRFMDVSSWLGTSEIKRNTSNIRSLYKSLFYIDRGGQKETFEEAVSRYKLNDTDIAQRLNGFYSMAMFYLFIYFLALCYIGWLLYYSSYNVAFIVFAFSMVVLAMFFRNHFWYTQVKHKRLGFTFQEWFFSLFK